VGAGTGAAALRSRYRSIPKRPNDRQTGGLRSPITPGRADGRAPILGGGGGGGGLFAPSRRMISSF